MGLLITATALFAVVIALGFAISSGWCAAFDKHVSATLNLQAGISPLWLIKTMQIISWIGTGAQRFIMIALLSAALWRYWGAGAGIAMALTSLLSLFTSEALKGFFGRLRPETLPRLDPVSNFAYPSGHATNAAVVYILFVLLMPKKVHVSWQIMAGFMIFVTGLSRVMLVVHWPTDVLGGWALGSGFAMAAYAVIAYVEHRKSEPLPA